MTSIRPFVTLSLFLLAPGASLAADDLASLRAELEALKAEYSSRVSALESRISRLEAAQAAATAESANAAVPENGASASQSAAPTGVAPAGESQGAPLPLPPYGSASTTPSLPMSNAAQTAFNPAISVILAGNYTHLSEDPETYRIAGFIPGGEEVGPGERSFDLGESELTLAANVDPYFFANLTASVDAENEISVEEAYFRTLALPSGFTLKAGRFFSGLGYLNEVHAHAWDFADQPLVYQAFFGGQLAQDGAQLKWLAPTVTFVELGAEVGNGDAFPGTRRNRNGLDAHTLFAHVGGDIGDSTSWRTGVSWLDERAEGRPYVDTIAPGVSVENAFSGRSRTWIVDGILKWAPHGNATRRQLELQAEYLHRIEDGQLAFDTAGANLIGDYRSRQSGWYVQSVYKFRPRWRVGLRYDSLDSEHPRIGLVETGVLPRSAFPTLLPASPERVTLMLDWTPSEFSRLRAQYAWDDARPDRRDRQLFIQYLYSIGAHGAHKF